MPASAGGTVSFVPTDPDLHLLRRATYGITPNLQKDIRRLGRNRWLEQQLDPTSINDAFVEDYIHDRMPNLNMGAAGSVGHPGRVVGPDGGPGQGRDPARRRGASASCSR